MFRKFLPFILSCLFLVGCADNAEKKTKDTAKMLEKTFVGKWEVIPQEDAKEKTGFIIVNPDGTATNSWESNAKGSWKIEAERLQIVFNNGYHNFIYLDCDKYMHMGYKPGDNLDSPARFKAEAKKVKS